MSELTCAKCQKTQSELTEALKRCSRCLQARYCSTDCQRAHWQEHKKQCSKPPTSTNEATRVRATCRLKWGKPAGRDTIYFLRKTLRHLDDITIAGPFYPRNAILEQLGSYLQKTSQAGMSLLFDFAKDEEMLGQLQHINAPLDSDPTKFMLIEVIEQHNPEMAAILPGPSYKVTHGSALLPVRAGEQGHPRMEAVEVHACFANMGEANKKAEEVAQDLMGDLQGGRIVNRSRERHGPFSCAITGQDYNGKMKALGLEVSFDSGQITYA